MDSKCSSLKTGDDYGGSSQEKRKNGVVNLAICEMKPAECRAKGTIGLPRISAQIRDSKNHLQLLFNPMAEALKLFVITKLK